jgi:hypothetical protein
VVEVIRTSKSLVEDVKKLKWLWLAALTFVLAYEHLGQFFFTRLFRVAISLSAYLSHLLGFCLFFPSLNGCLIIHIRTTTCAEQLLDGYGVLAWRIIGCLHR